MLLILLQCTVITLKAIGMNQMLNNDDDDDDDEGLLLKAGG